MRLITLVVLNLLLATCAYDKNQNVKKNENKIKQIDSIPLAENKIKIDESLNCLNLLDGIDRTTLKKIAKQFTTSTILSEKEKSNYGYRTTGFLGKYFLFINKEGSIAELGYLVVSVDKNVGQWQAFDSEEILLEIQILQPDFKINEELFVGLEIDKVIQDFPCLKKISENHYLCKSDCENLLITSTNNKVDKIKITRKGDS
ncbi:hypothetical protein C9994_09315 [Marivirga lumbricoides]|uniref:Uncharacterized protein n=1 Tax=Marivirga lumbricoides TaxID=1046115 RepID=A0A2T4DQF0_9BACT|nr:hypothetical protein C9994_09315 [Marivirga lumbricoides]